MITKPSVWLLLTATALAPFIAGCSSHEDIPPPPPPPPGQQQVIVESGPPAPIAEVRIVSPGPEYVYIEGAYAWDGRVWIWEPGHWALPPYRGAIWIGGRYYYRHGHRYWARGYWRR